MLNEMDIDVLCIQEWNGLVDLRVFARNWEFALEDQLFATESHCGAVVTLISKAFLFRQNCVIAGVQLVGPTVTVLIKRLLRNENNDKNSTIGAKLNITDNQKFYLRS